MMRTLCTCCLIAGLISYLLSCSNTPDKLAEGDTPLPAAKVIPDQYTLTLDLTLTLKGRSYELPSDALVFSYLWIDCFDGEKLEGEVAEESYLHFFQDATREGKKYAWKVEGETFPLAGERQELYIEIGAKELPGNALTSKTIQARVNHALVDRWEVKGNDISASASIELADYLIGEDPSEEEFESKPERPFTVEGRVRHQSGEALDGAITTFFLTRFNPKSGGRLMRMELSCDADGTFKEEFDLGESGDVSSYDEVSPRFQDFWGTRNAKGGFNDDPPYVFMYSAYHLDSEAFFRMGSWGSAIGENALEVIRGLRLRKVDENRYRLDDIVIPTPLIQLSIRFDLGERFMWEDQWLADTKRGLSPKKIPLTHSGERLWMPPAFDGWGERQDYEEKHSPEGRFSSTWFTTSELGSLMKYSKSGVYSKSILLTRQDYAYRFDDQIKLSIHASDAAQEEFEYGIDFVAEGKIDDLEFGAVKKLEIVLRPINELPEDEAGDQEEHQPPEKHLVTGGPVGEAIEIECTLDGKPSSARFGLGANSSYRSGDQIAPNFAHAIEILGRPITPEEIESREIAFTSNMTIEFGALAPRVMKVSVTSLDGSRRYPTFFEEGSTLCRAYCPTGSAVVNVSIREKASTYRLGLFRNVIDKRDGDQVWSMPQDFVSLEMPSSFGFNENYQYFFSQSPKGPWMVDDWDLLLVPGRWYCEMRKGGLLLKKSTFVLKKDLAAHELEMPFYEHRYFAGKARIEVKEPLEPDEHLSAYYTYADVESRDDSSRQWRRVGASIHRGSLLVSGLPFVRPIILKVVKEEQSPREQFTTRPFSLRLTNEFFIEYSRIAKPQQIVDEAVKDRLLERYSHFRAKLALDVHYHVKAFRANGDEASNDHWVVGEKYRVSLSPSLSAWLQELPPLDLSFVASNRMAFSESQVKAADEWMSRLEALIFGRAED